MEIPIKYQKIRNLWDYGRDGLLGGYIVKEKLDGANFRFMLDSEGELVFGSRNVSPINDGTVGGIKLDTTFTSYAEWVKEKVDKEKLVPDHVYFAEAMMRHSIKYDVPDKYKVVGFDVYDIRSEKWRSDWKKLFEYINIPSVKVYDIIEDFGGETEPQAIAKIVNEEEFVSMIDGESFIEGVVFADYHNQVFYKYRTDKFRQVQPVGKSTSDPIEQFFEKYFTLQRVRDKLIEMENGETGYNPRNPFPSLVGIVMTDVFAEAKPRDLRDTFKSYYAPRPVFDKDGNNIHERGYDLQSMLEDMIRANDEIMGRIMRLIEE